MTYNEKLIEKYKDFDKVIKTYYQAKDHNGKLVNLDGIINPLKIDNRQLCCLNRALSALILILKMINI